MQWGLCVCERERERETESRLLPNRQILSWNAKVKKETERNRERVTIISIEKLVCGCR